MAQADMWEYATVLAYMTEYVVEQDFLDINAPPGHRSLDLLAGEEIQLISKIDAANWWFGRLMGTDETGLFPADFVRKKWPFPTRRAGANFTTFVALPAHIRERIYAAYLDVAPETAIRAVLPAEREAILQQPSQTLPYINPARLMRTTRLLHGANLFATSRDVAREMVYWLLRSYPLRVLAYDTWIPGRSTENEVDRNAYPPLPMAFTLPLVGWTGFVNRLEVEVNFLTGVPKLLSEKLRDCNITNLRLTFWTYNVENGSRNYYFNFKDVVSELEMMSNLCVKEEVEIVWAQMVELFAPYTESDRETYGRGFLEPVATLKRTLRHNWKARFDPVSLLALPSQ